MAYELRSLARQKVLYNNANTTNPLTYQLVLNGEKVTPTSATITIYRRGSTTALVSAASMTVSGTLLTYAVSTTTTASWPVETGYRAEVTVTYSAATYKRTVIFDVVKFLLDLSIGVDQLIDIDDNVGGMIHATSDDLAGLIVASRTEIQAHLESKAIQDKKLVENMILDYSRLAVCACFHILAQLWLNKGNIEKHGIYAKKYETLLGASLSTINYDTGQDGDEDAEMGGLQEVRLET